MPTHVRVVYHIFCVSSKRVDMRHEDMLAEKILTPRVAHQGFYVVQYLCRQELPT